MPEKPITNLDELNNWIVSMESRTQKNEDFDKKVYSGFVKIDALIKKQATDVKRWKTISLLTSTICVCDILLIITLIILMLRQSDGILVGIPFLANLAPTFAGK